MCVFAQEGYILGGHDFFQVQWHWTRSLLVLHWAKIPFTRCYETYEYRSQDVMQLMTMNLTSARRDELC